MEYLVGPETLKIYKSKEKPGLVVHLADGIVVVVKRLGQQHQNIRQISCIYAARHQRAQPEIQRSRRVTHRTCFPKLRGSCCVVRGQR